MNLKNLKNKNLKKILIDPNKSIFETLKLLNRSKEKCLIVVNKNRQFLGTITDGDIRRAVIKTKKFKSNISKVYKKNAYAVYVNKIKKNNILKVIEKKHFPIVPILNEKKQPGIDSSHCEVFRKRNIDHEVIIHARIVSEFFINCFNCHVAFKFIKLRHSSNVSNSPTNGI